MRKRIFSTIACALVVLAILSPICHSASEGDDTTGTPPGWSDTINLSNSTMNDWYCTVAAYNDNIYVVWDHIYNPGGPPYGQIVYAFSQDGGNAGLHESGAGARTAAGQEDRHLGLRRLPPRGSDRPDALLGNGLAAAALGDLDCRGAPPNRLGSIPHQSNSLLFGC